MLRDAFERPIQYLRVSLTDRCNLRCVYCMPEEGVVPLQHADMLRYEELVRIVQVAVELGIVHVRLTGGEPLVRRDVVALVADLARIPGLDDLAITTNGMLLERYAESLARAGLRRVNLSLDTLQPERFAQLTRGGDLAQVLRGRTAALTAGLRPVKINTVVIRGMNDDEVVDLARLTLQPEWHVRFIEVMPLGQGTHWQADGVVPTHEIQARIRAALGELMPVGEHGAGIGPARYYRLPAAAGTLGFISPVTEHFCFACNRLRLTSTGQILPCLLSAVAFDLRAALRAGADDAALREIFATAIAAKPRSHHLAEQVPSADVLPMSCIGG